MPQTCPHCLKLLDFSGEPLRFCPYCGHSLGGDATMAFSEAGSTFGHDPDATVDHVGVGFGDTRPSTFPSDHRSVKSTHGLIRVPEVLAGYRLIKQLGQGGMGTVHEAEDSQTGRRVALKLIAPEFVTSTRAVDRFLQEGRLASTIAHPRCVFVLAADEADGWPFIVMELMPGNTLKDLIESTGFLSARRSIETILDVIEGLEEAHRRGIIHRDVKPSNCFLDADGRIKVGDFGLSKSVVDDSGLTRTGTFVGTPHFASPEQIKGEEIDERTDVYSVCATLFYLLTGHPPFQGADAASTLAKIVSDPTPSARVHRPDLWVPLDRVLMRGLERDKKRRWANLEELRTALSPFLPGRVTLSGIGLRAAAYLIDFVLTFFVIGLLLGLIGMIRFRADAQSFAMLDKLFSWKEEIVSGLTVLLYYMLFEVLGEGSPGKRLFRLRIGSSEAGPASSRSRIIRLMIFCVLVVLPRRVPSVLFPRIGLDGPWRIWLEGALQLLGPLVLFATARSSNGFRGLHEFGSGTAVVRLPWRFRRRKESRHVDSVHPIHLFQHPDLPKTLGAYRVQGALRWSDSCRMVQAEDVGLRRLVWIVLRPESGKTAARARTDLARLARLRWLSSGASDHWRWDAFVAPAGRPLLEPGGGKHKKRSWAETRELLEELADELVEAGLDQTLPDDLALDQVWVRPNGRLLLLDVCPTSAEPAAEAEAGDESDADPQVRGLKLLTKVASRMLQGTPVASETERRAAGSPVPRHAMTILQSLKGGTDSYRSIDDFREAIRSIRELPTELSPVQQLGHAAFTWLTSLTKIFLVPAIVLTFSIVNSYISHEPIPMDHEKLWERALLFETLVWAGLAMLIREGPSGWFFRVALVTRRGRVASPLRFALRELLLVGPILAVSLFVDPIPYTYTRIDFFLEYGALLFAVLWPILNLVPILFEPGRYLVDRLSGTILVPK